MSEQTEDFVVGAQDREPEEDWSGLYQARLADLTIYTKTPEDIEKEAQRWGKDPAKIDKRQYIWIFDVPDLQVDRDWRVYTGTFFGEKAKASELAAALIGHRPAKNEEIRRSHLVEKTCQVFIEYDTERGRNKIAKVTPPKRAASTLMDAATKALSEPGNVAPMDDAAWDSIARRTA